jgi:hypothetical protein
MNTIEEFATHETNAALDCLPKETTFNLPHPHGSNAFVFFNPDREGGMVEILLDEGPWLAAPVSAFRGDMAPFAG